MAPVPLTTGKVRSRELGKDLSPEGEARGKMPESEVKSAYFE